jgi:hypothetical protein
VPSRSQSGPSLCCCRTPAPHALGTMTEESSSVRSSQGSSRRAPKNVRGLSLSPHPAPNTKQPSLTPHPMQPQQQLSQIEKSVTHLLVATKQLLGASPAHAAPHTHVLTRCRDVDTMVARDRHRERGLGRLRASGL